MDVKELPARPNLDQYKKQAKDLMKACASGAPEGLWRVRQHRPASGKGSDAQTADRNFTLAEAQFAIAREHGFESWPKFARHIEGLVLDSSPISRFELAADAVVKGDISRLRSVLREDPDLVRLRSSRAHGAPLLHYVAANGVEDFRQSSPKNAVEVARTLLDSGAEVDATSEAYGGEATALGLVATSVHPVRAGVQISLLETLLQAGANVDGVAENWTPLVAALRNGRGEAAAFLADRGARLDLEGSAGVGWLDVVESFFQQDGALKPNVTRTQMESGFLWACEYGRDSVVGFLLRHGMDLTAHAKTGLTGPHWAVVGGQLDTIKLLIKHGAPLEVTNTYGGTVLGQAVWSAIHGDRTINYVAIIETLLAAGAKIDAVTYPTGSHRLDEVLQRFGVKPPQSSAGQPTAGTASDVADDLIQRALQARREKRLLDAKRDLIDAVALLRQHGSRSDLARAIRELAELERHLPDAEAALQHYQEAVAILRELNEPLRLAHAIRHLGDVHHDAGQAASAESCYQEALAIYRGNEDTKPLELANAIRSLAVLKGEAAEIDEATRLWREAHDLYATVNVPPGVAESAARLAILAWRHGDGPRSREWLSAAKAAAEASDDPKFLRYVGQVKAMIES